MIKVKYSHAFTATTNNFPSSNGKVMFFNFEFLGSHTEAYTNKAFETDPDDTSGENNVSS